MSLLPEDYPQLLDTIKRRIRQAQTRAVQSANRELVALYWEIGRQVDVAQNIAGWGARVIERLAGLRDAVTFRLHRHSVSGRPWLNCHQALIQIGLNLRR